MSSQGRLMPALRTACLGLALFLGSPPPSAHGDPPEAVKRIIECHALALMEAQGLPSLSLALVEADRLYWAKAWGFANRDPCIPATPRSVYEMASLAKPVTAVALLSALHPPGGRRLADFIRETPVTTWLPGTVDGSCAITLSMLLAHRTLPSGIAPHDDPLLWGFEEREPLAWDLAAWRLAPAPGQTGEFYSKFTAYVMVGYILALLSTGQGEVTDWPHCARAWRQLVWDPLGAGDSGIDVRPRSMERLTLPYGPRGEGHQPQDIFVHRQHSSWGAYTTPSEYAGFLGACLNRGAWEGEPALLAAAVEASLESPEGATPDPSKMFGHGWARERTETANLIHKSGIGFSSGCYALGDLADGRGGCVFTSSSGSAAKVLTRQLRDFLETCVAAMRGSVSACAASPPAAAGVAGAYVDLTAPNAWPPKVALLRATPVGLMVVLPGAHHLLLARDGAPAGAFVYFDARARTLRDVTLSQDPDKPRVLQLPVGTFTRVQAASPLPAAAGGPADWKNFHNVWEGLAEPVPPDPMAGEDDDAPPLGLPTRVVLDVRPGDSPPRVFVSGLSAGFAAERADNLRTDGRVLHVEVPGGARLEPTWLDVRLEAGRLVGFHRSGVRLERVTLLPRPELPLRVSDLVGRWRGDLWVFSTSIGTCPERVELRLRLEASGEGTVDWIRQGVASQAAVRATAQGEQVEVRVQTADAPFTHLLLTADEGLAGRAHDGNGPSGYVELRRVAPVAQPSR